MVVVAQAHAQARDHAQQFGARLRLAREFLVDAAFAALQQFAHVERGAGRAAAGVLEQADDEVLHRLRPRRFPHRLPRLPGDHAQRGQQHQRDRQARGQRPAMAAHVLARAVGQAVWPRVHRLAVEPALQVQRQRLHRGIALLGLLRHRLEHDVVEVAGHLVRLPAHPRIRSVPAAGRLALQRLRGTHGIDVEDRVLPLRIALALELVGLAAGQDLVEHHAQRIHVGHGGDRLAADLFGRGVVQGERAQAGAGVVERLLGRVEQLGDAEVEQAHVVEWRDQDVRRLEVAVHDQVGVRVADRVADLQEQLHARGHARPARAAPVGDRFAFHVFQREVGLVVAADAGVEQARDVRVLQPREDLALAGEAQAQVGIGQARAQQLQRDPPLVQAVRAPRQPDLAHAAFAEHAFEFVRADGGAGVHARVRGDQRFGEEVLAPGFERQQFLEVVGQLRIVLAQRGQALRARLLIQLEQCIEQRREALPAFGVHKNKVSRAARRSLPLSRSAGEGKG